MCCGDAFVLQAPTELAGREQAADERWQRGRPPDLPQGLTRRTVAEVVLAIVVGIVIGVLAALGGLASVPVTDDGCLVDEATVCILPDIMTICREDGGDLRCLREPT